MAFYMRCQNSDKTRPHSLVEINSLHERPNSRQCKAYIPPPTSSSANLATRRHGRKFYHQSYELCVKVPTLHAVTQFAQFLLQFHNDPAYRQTNRQRDRQIVSLTLTDPQAVVS